MSTQRLLLLAALLYLIFPCQAQVVLHPTINASAHLEPTLNWDNDPRTRQVWEHLKQEGRVNLDARTGNYIISYTNRAGQQRTWTFEPANKLLADVDVRVTYDEKTGLYRYAYSVKNSADSKQNLYLFGVEYIESDIRPPVVPQENVETEGHRFFFPTYQYRNTAVWVEKLHGIPPGKQSGAWFYFESPQPPGVVKCYAQGYVPIPKFATGDAPGEESDPRPTSLSGNCVVGLTIGAVRPREEPLPQVKDIALSVSPVQEEYWLIQKDMEATVTIKNTGQQEEQILSTEPRYDYRLSLFRADGTPVPPRVDGGKIEGKADHPPRANPRRLAQKIAPGKEIQEIIRITDWFTFDQADTYTLIVTRRLWSWDTGFAVASPITIKIVK